MNMDKRINITEWQNLALDDPYLLYSSNVTMMI